MNNLSIDDEWEKYITPKYNEISSDDEEEEENNSIINNIQNDKDKEKLDCLIPESTEIYISTKSKIAYLNQDIDLKKIFWGVKVLDYSTPKNGVIKKQMKFNSTTKEELELINENIKRENNYHEEQVITSIDNPNGRIKFKDIRKISIGISKKDLLSYRCKKKSAFYNCFVMILRIKIKDLFREFHIKVFNTGKMEIPGIQSEEIFETVLLNIITTLQPFVESELNYLQKSDTILINSNFNCGFYINRETLFDLLKFKYNIQCIYDPCSYPGIQCKFYYNKDLTNQTGSQISEENKDKYKNIVEVSFMIFRTGSILIVGMCEDYVLYYIYEFLKKLLVNEFHEINQKIITNENRQIKEKTKKIRKKNIIVNITL